MGYKTDIYIAGMGMITPVGANIKMTAAAIKAGISAYSLSNYEDQQGNAITMATVPDELFSATTIDIGTGNYYRHQYDRIIKMAAHALQDTFSNARLVPESVEHTIPLVLAMPESSPHLKQIEPRFLVKHMVKASGAPVRTNLVRSIHSGRAAVIESLDMAHRYLHDMAQDYVLLGGSDSYRDIRLINELTKSQRWHTTVSNDGFAPGEAAGFLLLTRHPQHALKQNGHIIKIHLPGIGKEQGHLKSTAPNLGEGLDQAFKRALKHCEQPISTIYSSMNGEGFWSKEYGVAYIRNQKYMQRDVAIEHPADCYGDVGAATGSVLIGLAAIQLLQQANTATHLVYSSSDGEKRAAVCVEKVVFM